METNTPAIAVFNQFAMATKKTTTDTNDTTNNSNNSNQLLTQLEQVSNQLREEKKLNDKQSKENSEMRVEIKELKSSFKQSTTAKYIADRELKQLKDNYNQLYQQLQRLQENSLHYSNQIEQMKNERMTLEDTIQSQQHIISQLQQQPPNINNNSSIISPEEGEELSTLRELIADIQTQLMDTMKKEEKTSDEHTDRNNSHIPTITPTNNISSGSNNTPSNNSTSNDNTQQPIDRNSSLPDRIVEIPSIQQVTSPKSTNNILPLIVPPTNKENGIKIATIPNNNTNNIHIISNLHTIPKKNDNNHQPIIQLPNSPHNSNSSNDETYKFLMDVIQDYQERVRILEEENKQLRRFTYDAEQVSSFLLVQLEHQKEKELQMP